MGKVMEVLVEEKTVFIDGKVFSQGHARSYFKVLIPGELAPNSRVVVRVEKSLPSREALLGATLT